MFQYEIPAQRRPRSAPFGHNLAEMGRNFRKAIAHQPPIPRNKVFIDTILRNPGMLHRDPPPSPIAKAVAASILKDYVRKQSVPQGRALAPAEGPLGQNAHLGWTVDPFADAASKPDFTNPYVGTRDPITMQPTQGDVADMLIQNFLGHHRPFGPPAY